MSALAPNSPLIINIIRTSVHHILKVEALISLVDFILDNTGLALSLMAQKSLVSVRSKNDSTLIF